MPNAPIVEPMSRLRSPEAATGLRARALLLVLQLLLLFSAGVHAAEDPAGPVLRVQAGLLAAAGSGWPPPPAEVQRLVAQNFDLDEITRAVLGTHASAATAAQRDRLARALANRMVREILHRPPVRDVAVVNTRAISATDWIVTTRSETGDGAPVVLGWRVRERDGTLRIIDALRNGTSAVITEHEAFISALGGSDLERVIAQLEQHSLVN